MGGIDGGMDIIPDDEPGEEINEDDKIPADMVDEEFCPVTSPHEIFLPNVVAWVPSGVTVFSRRVQPGQSILSDGRPNWRRDTCLDSAASPGSAGGEGAGSVLLFLQWPVVQRG